jgi:chemotaxis methyl-accepting protein methylase/nitrogen-specific signal transduction histidine kinase
LGKTGVENRFFIVGMGGSAGGFEAFEEFFHNVPLGSGIAFVLVMHLDPTKKGSLPELVQRFTSMPVQQAGDDMRVEPDHVYVIPPNKDIIIEHGVLRLLDPTVTQRGMRLPIDVFFRSLAEDQKEMGVGIVFSGMVSDGTLGVKAIKENLGLVMVQDPGDAKFDSMPNSAISTGLVDYIAPAKDLPRYLFDYTRAVHTIQKKSTETVKATSLFDQVLVIIRRRTGHDFSFYKETTIRRRIERRMSVHRITNLADYIKYLHEHTGEIDLLFKDLLIGVTDFFRDKDAFEALKDALKKMLEDKPDGEVVRAWVPGCSTGEEAYSIAMLMAECLGVRRNKVQIFATDIDSDAIEVARKGVYPDSITADVSKERLKSFFTKDNDKLKVKKDIRDMVVFAEQDLIVHPPFTNIDVVSCRNLLIYLKTETQQKILSIFSYSLNPGGILFLGQSESIGAMSDAFLTLDTKNKIFKRKDYVSKREAMTYLPMPILNPLEKAGEKSKQAINITAEAQQAIIESFSPPAVLVNDKGDILYINGQIGKYLEPTPGKANMNIFSMAHNDLRNDIGIAIDKATRENSKITVKGVTFKEDTHQRTINIIVKPITHPEPLKNSYLVVFEDVEVPKITKASRTMGKLQPNQLIAMEEQLEHAKQRLQSTQDEMQTSQEEMKSINEELQSTNEELQSTNEELTTSKEELQSLNEELSTVNSELETKNEVLIRESDDMRNLLNSTETATIFLNNTLNITRFTPKATKIINLKDTDIGRPITDISTSMVDEDIAADSGKVLENLTPALKEVTTKDGLVYSMRIIPYRTVDNVINGVVVTFNDITNLKVLEKSLIEARNNAESARDYAESIVETIREPLVVLDDDMKVVSANNAFYETFHVSPEETTSDSFFSLGNGQWNIPALKSQLEEVLPKKHEIRNFKIERDLPEIGKHFMLLNARKIQQKTGKALILLAIQDTTTCKPK